MNFWKALHGSAILAAREILGSWRNITVRRVADVSQNCRFFVIFLYVAAARGSGWRWAPIEVTEEALIDVLYRVLYRSKIQAG